MSFTSPPARDAPFVPGGWLSSGSTDYLLQSFLGQGAFGTVAKCTRTDDMRTVAIKMMKNEDSNVFRAEEEVSTLSKLKLLDSDKCNIVRWYQVFTDKGHICLEFEHLDKSLFDFMKDRYFRPLLLKEIRPIVQQIANALCHFKVAGIIHADLKLENVMLVNHGREPYRVKVIDFGLACDVSATELGSYLQTRPYRSPEIILGLPFTEAIDMWSLGCVAAALYLGTLLYPGNSEYDMMSYIVETQGLPPDNLLAAGLKTSCFFQRDSNSTSSLWKLKTPEQFLGETGIQPMETRTLKLRSLDDLLSACVINHDNAADRVAEMTDVLVFVDMLKGMLQIDAGKRITPRQVLEHHFTSMCHIVNMYPLSSHIRSCFEIMEQTLTLDSGGAVSGSLQQPSSSTTRPIQQHLPPRPPAKRGGLSQPDCINPHPCTCTQTTSTVKSGVKRKVDDEDGDMDQTSHLSKRIESSSSSSSRLDSTNYIQASTALRRHLSRPVHHHVRSHSPKSSQTQSCVRQGIKRKMADGDDVWRQPTNSHHYERSDDDRKRYRKRFRWSRAPPGVKRKRAHGEDSEYCERSAHERKRVKKSYAGPSTCSGGYDSIHSLHIRPDQRSVQRASSKQHPDRHYRETRDQNRHSRSTAASSHQQSSGFTGFGF